ncbi:hypothetical protein C8R47DRAFT_1065143 [Mycena vitilis]|nr:hypothetical protein C8R47DRAFT_1065143 [Mycena vitilis]
MPPRGTKRKPAASAAPRNNLPAAPARNTHDLETRSEPPPRRHPRPLPSPSDGTPSTASTKSKLILYVEGSHRAPAVIRIPASEVQGTQNELLRMVPELARARRDAKREPANSNVTAANSAEVTEVASEGGKHPKIKPRPSTIPHYWLVHEERDGYVFGWLITSCGNSPEEKERCLSSLPAQLRAELVPLDPISETVVPDTVSGRYFRGLKPALESVPLTGFLVLAAEGKFLASSLPCFESKSVSLSQYQVSAIKTYLIGVRGGGSGPGGGGQGPSGRGGGGPGGAGGGAHGGPGGSGGGAHGGPGGEGPGGPGGEGEGPEGEGGGTDPGRGARDTGLEGGGRQVGDRDSKIDDTNVVTEEASYPLSAWRLDQENIALHSSSPPIPWHEDPLLDSGGEAWSDECSDANSDSDSDWDSDANSDGDYDFDD